MSVYQNKKRGTYYIKVCVGGRYFYCYKPAEPGSKSFKRKKDAQLYEPVFLSTLTESDADKGILCDDLAQIFLNEQTARLKPNTYYGVERTFRKYVLPCFRGMRVGDVTNAYLDTVNAKLNKRRLNVYQQACFVGGDDVQHVAVFILASFGNLEALSCRAIVFPALNVGAQGGAGAVNVKNQAIFVLDYVQAFANGANGGSNHGLKQPVLDARAVLGVHKHVGA